MSPESPLRVTRRSALAGGGAVVATGAVTSFDAAHDEADAATNPYFRHGVASGDPYPNSVVIWTRVTPTAGSLPGSGAGPRVAVKWEVATDPKFRRIVKKGSFATGPGRDHTVKLAPGGLKPSTWYYYRFTYKGRRSRTGRTRTAPGAGSTPTRVRFGVVSCANLQAGWFSSYRHLAQRADLHAILHLGDYFYEYAPGQYGLGQKNVNVRRHVPAKETVTLADYRRRHAQYKQDTDLANLHARLPFIATWDDHESANDSHQSGAENHTPGTEGTWGRRRSASARAYDEWMPVRMNGDVTLNGGRLYRRLAFGQLAELTMLDLRSYRSAQVKQYESGKVDDPDRTITGAAQMAYLKGSL
ncbi:MAG: alkaline phosphatase, partial [Myxococcales bacterium]